MSQETAILVTLIIYKIVLLGIGFFASGKTKDGTDFFLGGRSLGPTVAALSASASSSIGYCLPNRRFSQSPSILMIGI